MLQSARKGALASASALSTIPIVNTLAKQLCVGDPNPAATAKCPRHGGLAVWVAVQWENQVDVPISSLDLPRSALHILNGAKLQTIKASNHPCATFSGYLEVSPPSSGVQQNGGADCGVFATTSVRCNVAPMLSVYSLRGYSQGLNSTSTHTFVLEAKTLGTACSYLNSPL